jgi:hypothetical protein
MHHQNLEKLKRLRLFGMARALEDLENLADRGQMDFADQLALLIDREATDRANAALHARLRQARLRQAACFENLNMKAVRGLDKSMIRDLFTCRWIGEHRHLILTGKTGTGGKAGWRVLWAIKPPVRATACSTPACRARFATAELHHYRGRDPSCEETSSAKAMPAARERLDEPPHSFPCRSVVLKQASRLQIQTAGFGRDSSCC